MISPTTSTPSLHYRQRDTGLVPGRDSDDQEIEVVFSKNKQIAKSVCCYALLSPDILSILLKERIKTQEYQPVTDLVVFEIDEVNNIITFV